MVANMSSSSSKNISIFAIFAFVVMSFCCAKPVRADTSNNVATRGVIAASNSSTCVIISGGRVECFGNGTYMPGASYEPLMGIVSGIGGTAPGAVALFSDPSEICAVLDTGDKSCWSTNETYSYVYGASYFSLYDGLVTPDRSWWDRWELPSLIASLDIVNVVSDQDRMCVITDTRRVYCWDVEYLNGDYRLVGYGFPRTYDSQGLPVESTTDDYVQDGLGNVVLAKELVVVPGGICILKPDLKVVCLEHNDSTFRDYQFFGELDFEKDESFLALKESMYSWIGIPDGFSVMLPQVCAQESATTLVCKELGWYGLHRNLSYTAEHPIVDFAVGEYHVCAVLDTGQVQCWGSNSQNQLGQPQDLACWQFDGMDTMWKCFDQTAIVPNLQVPVVNSAISDVAVISTTSRQAVAQVSFEDSAESLATQQVEYSIDDGFTWHIPNVNIASGTVTVSKLNPGQSYIILLRTASNLSDPSTVKSLSFTLPPEKASAPTISSLRQAGTSLELSIQPPSSLGDVSISGYEYSQDTGQTWQALPSVSGRYAIAGLTAESAYLIKVRAINRSGAGEASASKGIYFTKKVPAAPVIGSSTRGDRQAVAFVVAPTDPTGQTVTGYQYNINGSLTWLECVMVDGGCRMTGLNNGAKSIIRLRAVNVNGYSLPSAKFAVTPVGLPGAPILSSVEVGAGSVRVSFIPPADNGGSRITSYQYSVNDGDTWMTATRPVTSSPFSITGLSNVTNYRIRLRAVNSVGVGSQSEAIDATTPATVPSAPTLGLVVAGRTTLTANFAAPANSGGAAVTSYMYTLDGKSWSSSSPSVLSSPLVITGLVPNRSYTVRLRAVNRIGVGVVSISRTVKTLK